MNEFSFIKPYLSFIDSGSLYRKPFSWLYLTIGILNLITPFVILYLAIDRYVFDLSANYIVVFILVWLVVGFVSWLSFQLWWNRRNNVLVHSSKASSEDVAMPGFAHFIQTLGEWIGAWIAVVGCIFSLLSALFLQGEATILRTIIPVTSGGSAWGIATEPIIGFLIIVISRFIADKIRTFSVKNRRPTIYRNPTSKPNTKIRGYLNP
ncbi:hypothetical protein FACS1894199_02210 [Bacteroidia bacterium]|nr:hypothetical protein FACS1894199_02210 [Bacteroidia bacterium]